MAVRFEIFSILGVLCWSTCSKQRKFQFLCSKMLYRGLYWLLTYFWLGRWAFSCKIVKWMAVRFEIFSISGYCVGVHVVKTQKIPITSLQNVIQRSLLATLLLLTWSMSILVQNCKMGGSQIWNFLYFVGIALDYM